MADRGEVELSGQATFVEDGAPDALNDDNDNSENDEPDQGVVPAPPPPMQGTGLRALANARGSSGGGDDDEQDDMRDHIASLPQLRVSNEDGDGDGDRDGDEEGELVFSGRPPPPVSPVGQAKFALLLVSLQNDFLGEDGPVCPDSVGADFVERVNKLRDALPWVMVLHTRAQHPVNRASFSSVIPGSRPFTTSTTKTGEPVLVFPDYCVMGTYGSQLHAGVHRREHDVVVETGLTAALDDNGPFSTTSSLQVESVAEMHLLRVGITDLVVVGVDVDGEAFAGSLDVMSDSGINFHFIHDLCHTTYEAEDIWTICNEMGGTVWSEDEFMKSNQALEMREPQEHGFGDFRLAVFDSLLRMADGNCSPDTISAFIEEEMCHNEVTQPHPITGKLLLHYLAAKKTTGAVAMVQLLLREEIVDVNVETAIEEKTAVMIACETGNLPVLLVLLEFSPDLVHNDCVNRTCMMYALSSREQAVVQAVLAKGGKRLLHAQDIGRRSVLMQACLFAGDSGTPRKLKSERHRGKDVLMGLWQHFESREFADLDGDTEGWTFWNYAVKHDLSRMLGEAFKVFTRHTPNQRRVEEDANAFAVRESEGRGKSNRLVADDGLLASPLGSRRAGTASSSFDPSNPTSKLSSFQSHAKGKTLPLSSVLLKTIAGGMTLLHQASWQKQQDTLTLLLPRYSQQDLLHVTIENGMSCVDLAVEDINPEWAFALIKAGCVPKQKAGLPMKYLCLKAILLGEPLVVKAIVMSNECGAMVDKQMVDMITRAKGVQSCTGTFSSSTSPLTQLAFTCGTCEEQRPNGLYCCVCVHTCHKGHKGLVCKGTDSFHCGCSLNNECSKRRVAKLFDWPYDMIQASGDPNDRRSSHRSSRRVSQIVRFSLVEGAAPPVLLGERKKELVAPQGNNSNQRLGVPQVRPSFKVGAQGNRPAKARSFRRQITNPDKQEEALGSELQQELQHLHNMSYRDYLRTVCLNSAAKINNEAIIVDLVEWIETDHAIDADLDRPLHLAAKAGHTTVCALLKRHGARVSTTNAKGETPLHLAAQYGHVQACEVLAHSSNVLRMDAMALTPLHHAVRNNKPHVVEFLADFLRHRSKVALDINVLHSRPRGQTAPMTRASRPSLSRRHTSLAQLVCDVKGVSPTVLALESGECEGHAAPLHLAVRYGNVECAKVLIRYGASPLHVDSTGFSPYQTAIWEQYVSRIRLESHHMHTTRHVMMGEGKRERRISNAPFFDGYRLTAHGRDMQRELEELRRGVPTHVRTLGLHVTHELLDTMGETTEVEKTRRAFSYQHLFKWVIAYLIVLALFISFAIPRTEIRYDVSRMLLQSIENSGFNNITRIADVREWQHDHVYSLDALVPVFVDHTQFPGISLLGAVRLKQVRSKHKVCNAPEYVDGLDGVSCVPHPMSKSHETTALHTWRVPATTGDPYIDDALANAREHRDASGRGHTLDFGTYSAHGYYLDLDLQAQDNATNALLLQMLHAPDSQGNRWLDVHTRLVLTDFVLYNINLNVFSVVSLLVECGAAAQCVPTHSVQVYTLEQSTLGTFPSVGFKFASALMVLYMVCNVVAKFIRVGLRKGLRKAGTLFDMLLGGFVLVLFTMDVVTTVRVHSKDIDFATTVRYQSLEKITDLIETQSYILSCVLLLLWLRLIKYTVLLPRFGRVTFAFMNTVRNFEVLSYLVFMFFVVLGFVCVYRIAFGQVQRTSTYDGSFGLLMQMMMGEWSEDVFVQLPEIVGIVLFIAFMIVVAVVFINLFISVLSEVYPREKQRATVQCADNLTQLIQHEHILYTHPVLRNRANSALRVLVHTNVTVPLVSTLGIVLRLVNPTWNFDVPRTEFGWEKGRAFFRQKLVDQAEEAQGPDVPLRYSL